MSSSNTILSLDLDVHEVRPEVQGTGDATRVVRMVPWKDYGANEGHSCVKGLFAYSNASHRDRQLSPMVRDSVHDEW